MKWSLFLFLLIMVSCKKTDSQSNITLNDVDLDLRYQVLNQLIDNDSISFQPNDYIFITTLRSVYLSENELDIPQPLGFALKYDSIFSIQDSAYYRRQGKIIANFRFDKTKIRRKLQYATDEDLHQLGENRESDFWTEFGKKFGHQCIRTFSIPFFNKDKTMCIVQNSTSCGYLSGSGYTAIYKKINGKWIEVNSFQHWIS